MLIDCNISCLTRWFTFKIIILFICIGSVLSIRCYQCSSQQDPKGQDNCGAYRKFNSSQHIAIECNSDESHMPGSFCIKVVQQGPKGFIWDGRWRQVIRRCASVADTGVTGICNWGVYENGVYWEECYCANEACNKAPRQINMPLTQFAGMLLFGVFASLLRF